MIDGFSEQHLCTLPQVADSMSCGEPVDGIFRSKTETDTSNDLVNLSNGQHVLHVGKAFTDRAMLLDIQSCM